MLRTAVVFMGFCSLLIFCCSCQKCPRRIVVPLSANAPSSSYSEEPLPVTSITTAVSSDDLVDDSTSFDEDDVAFEALEREAKLSDIPIPSGVCPLPEYFTKTGLAQGIVLGYCCTNERAAILSFYESQMPGLGWCNQACFDGVESIRLFQKPDRICIISLRNHRRGYCSCQQLVITIIFNK